MPEFEYSGQEELKRTIEHAPEAALQAAVPAMNDAMLFLHGRLPDYPQPPDGPGHAPGWGLLPAHTCPAGDVLRGGAQGPDARLGVGERGDRRQGARPPAAGGIELGPARWDASSPKR